MWFNFIENKTLGRGGSVVAAVVMIAYGLNAGGFKDVLSRAVMICLECVGIG